VTVVANANLGYAFSNWTETGVTVSTNATYTFTASTDRTLVANFIAVPIYTISTATAPTAGGVTAGGGQYSSGARATVTATANAGYVFSRWTVSGTPVSTASTYNFTVNGNKALVATFVTAGTQQTIATSPSPTLGGFTSGDGIYASGDSATVSATAYAGYAFSKWQEGSTTVSTSPSYTFTVTGSRTLVAKFNEAFVVATTSSPAAGGTTEMDSVSYKTGETAVAKAFPAAGYHFANWTENGVILSTNASYSFKISSNRTLVANFLSDTGVTVTTNAATPAGGTVSGDGAYALDDFVTVSAIPNDGFGFVNWTEADLVVSTNPDYGFTASGNRALVAHFAATVPIAASASAGGSVSGDGNYALGASATLSAVPEPGYLFENWTEGGVVASNSADYTFTVTSPRSLLANFSRPPAMAMTSGASKTNVMVFSWPDTPGWILQESADLETWVNSERPVTIVAGHRTITVSTAGQGCFFRLYRP
jgi:hypothetical protein